MEDLDYFYTHRVLRKAQGRWKTFIKEGGGTASQTQKGVY
jgi:hypothetical protein